MQSLSADAFLQLSLVQRLRLVQSGVDEFVGAAPTGYVARVYGGHLLSQALTAAAETVAVGSEVLSLQAYFLRPGVPDLSLKYAIRRLRDGRTISVRGVDVIQGGSTLASVQVSFIRTMRESAPSRGKPMPIVPRPEDLEPLYVRRARAGSGPDGFKWVPGEDWQKNTHPLDIRYVEPESENDQRCFWFRAAPAAGEQVVQRAVLAFASDRSLMATVQQVHGDLAKPFRSASLDHGIWFHSHVNAGDWWLYVLDCPVGSSSLGLVRGLMYSTSGELVASVVQQGVISPQV
jgi:acyl-CoA thioesterase-2